MIYIPTDNTAASCTETIGSIVLNAKTPVIAGEKGICAGCGVATLSISYYDLGYKTGEMAAQVLTGEADIAEMPIQYAPAAKMYNPTVRGPGHHCPGGLRGHGIKKFRQEGLVYP